MRKSNVALRLQTSLLEEAKRVAESEGVAVNQLINVAVAEKLSALRTEEYFRERSRRADIPKAKRILNGLAQGSLRSRVMRCRARQSSQCANHCTTTTSKTIRRQAWSTSCSRHDRIIRYR